MRAKLKALAPCITVLMLMFIWGHSMMPGDNSSAESDAVAEMLRQLFSNIGVNISVDEYFVRKLAHFTEFGFLSLSVMLTLYAYNKPVLLSPFIVYICACIDECIQLFVPEREGKFTDTLIDFSGAVVYMVLILVLIRVFKIRTK